LKDGKKEGKMRKGKGRKKLRTGKFTHEENARKTKTMYSKNEGKQTQSKTGEGKSMG
jgi:hypothetical protein